MKYLKLETNLRKLFKKTVLFLIGALLLSAVEVRTAERNVAFEIRYETGEVNQFAYNQYLRRIERIANRLTRGRQNRLPVRIVVQKIPEGIRFRFGNPVLVELTSDGGRLKEDWKLNRQLISVMLLAFAGINPEPHLDAVPEWLTTAIYGDTKIKENMIQLPMTRRPGLLAITAADAFPDVLNGLAHPLQPERDGMAAYRLFEEFSVLVLTVSEGVSTGKDPVLFRYLVQSLAPKASPKTVFLNTVGQVLIAQGKRLKIFQEKPGPMSDEAKLQAYFNWYAGKNLLTNFTPISARMSQIAFQQVCKFKYQVKKGAKIEEQEAPLENFPLVWQRMEEGQKTLDEVRQRLIDLTNRSAPLIAGEMFGLVNLFNEIRAGGFARPETHREEIRRRVGLIRQVIDWQLRIEERLRELEARAASPGVRFHQEIEEARRSFPLLPQVETVLDKYEKELQDFR